jgi:hypothetical protein
VFFPRSLFTRILTLKKETGLGLQRTNAASTTAGKPGIINDDLLLEIFDACRVDNISPNTYPRNWWHNLAHVCQSWRRVLLAFPIRLGVTLVCNSRTPVADMLANSQTLPLIIYWGNPGTLDDKDSVENVHLALRHRDRVCRIKLRLPESSLCDVFTTLEGTFPMLETLQLYCSSYRYGEDSRGILPSSFDAPNLRHLQISDSTLLPTQQSPLLNSLKSIVTFSIDEITPDLPPKRLVEYILLMGNLKILKISQGTSKNRDREQRADQESSPSTPLTNLEELQYHGVSGYFESLAALISAPSLKKLSITFINKLEPIGTRFGTTPHSQSTPLFKHLPRLISEAWDLRFPYARLRYRDGLSIVMDHNELWTGRGAFELRFNLGENIDIAIMAQICCLLSPMPSTVQSLLLEDGNVGHHRHDVDRKKWHDLLRPFDNVKTLRVAHLFVEEIDRSLRPADKGGAPVLTLLPRLEDIVLYGPDKEFSAFVEARRVEGSSVRVVSGPKNRLTLV